MMSARELGHPKHIRVVTNREQFAKWWPEFCESVGKYPVIGLNCKKNSPNVLIQMDRLKHGLDDDPPPVSPQLREEWDRIGPPIQGDFDYDYEVSPQETDPIRNRDNNAKKGRVSLIQLASFGGNVILFRSCFFDSIPQGLHSLLEQDIVKVSQGLERDKRSLLDSFGLIPSCYADIRQVCARWPYFTAHFHFERYGIRSIAKWMLGYSFDDWGQLCPYWITRHLEEEQIRLAAQEVQLYVDIFTLTMLRYLGWSLPKNWLSNQALGQIMFYWSACLFEKPFLDSKFRPVPVKEVSLTAGKRSLNHSLLLRLKEELVVKGKLRLATLWAWSLPGDPKELERMISRDPAGVLPSAGYPFMAVNLLQILDTDHTRITRDRDWKKALTLSATSTQDGKTRKYRIRLTVSLIDENALDGWDGGGDPLDIGTAFAGGEAVCERVMEEVVERACPRVKTAAESAVPFLATRKEWKQIEEKQSSRLENHQPPPEEEHLSPYDLLFGSPNHAPSGTTEVSDEQKLNETQETRDVSQSVGSVKEEGPRSRYDKFYQPARGRQYPGKKDVYKGMDTDGSVLSELGLLTSGPLVHGSKNARALFISPQDSIPGEEEEGVSAFKKNGTFHLKGEGEETPVEPELEGRREVTEEGDTQGFLHGKHRGGFTHKEGGRGGFDNTGFPQPPQRFFGSRPNWRGRGNGYVRYDRNRHTNQSRDYRGSFMAQGGFPRGHQQQQQEYQPRVYNNVYRPYQGRMMETGGRGFRRDNGVRNQQEYANPVEQNRHNGFFEMGHGQQGMYQRRGFQDRGAGRWTGKNFRRNGGRGLGGGGGGVRGGGRVFSPFNRSWNQQGGWENGRGGGYKGGFDSQSGSLLTPRFRGAWNQ